jgi:hypothetical protein
LVFVLFEYEEHWKIFEVFFGENFDEYVEVSFTNIGIFLKYRLTDFSEIFFLLKSF